MYDYVAGKADWMASGLPTEGTRAEGPRAGGAAVRDVPRLRLEETVGEARARMDDGWELAVVVNDHDVVLGTVRTEVLGMDAGRSVSEIMAEGPSTFRPDVAIAELARRLRRRGMARALVTTSEGVLIGLVRLADLGGEPAERLGDAD
ncbi:MAG: CBS domain-containing protein [Actinomycetota bacterium]